MVSFNIIFWFISCKVIINKMKHQGFRSRILSHLFIFNNFLGFIKNLCQYSLTFGCWTFFKTPRLWVSVQSSVSVSVFKLQRCLSLSKAKLGIFYNSSIPHTLNSQLLTPNQKNVSICFYFFAGYIDASLQKEFLTFFNFFIWKWIVIFAVKIKN